MHLLFVLVACQSEPDLARLQDPAACASCHPTHFEEWSGSMHAYASEDPLFRALNAKGQRETNGALGDTCVRCHAPLAVELGLTTDGLNLDAIDPALLGVNCYYCHSIAAVDGTHGNPLALAGDGVMRGGYDDPRPSPFHESAYSPLLDRDQPASSQVCGSCHDIVVDTPMGELHTERTYAEWRGSVYNRDDLPFQGLQCGNCHLTGEDAPIATLPSGEALPVRRRHAHTFPAVDVALTPWPGRDVQRSLIQAELDTVLNPRLCVDVDPVGGDTTLLVDLENIAAGHSFPSGAASDRRVWVELVALSEGEEVFVSGRVPDGIAVDDVADPTRWQIGDTAFDMAGEVTHELWEIASFESALLPAPTAFTEEDPRWQDPHRIREWTFEGTPPDEVRMNVYLRPFPLNVARSLVATENVDPAVVDAIPTFTLGSAALTWTADLGRACVPQ
jgi:hypothetical protein